MTFNPRAQINVVEFGDVHRCVVVDDALSDPEQLVRYAAEHSGAFQAPAVTAYPGVTLAAPANVTADLAQYFSLHARRQFDARRLVSLNCLLSMVTLLPAQLRPFQRLCHSDTLTLDQNQSAQACVLYLFKDETLGGTSFYQPLRSREETAKLFDHSVRLAPKEFAQRYPMTPGYMTGSNPYFMRIGGITARWNRLIIYDGTVLHSGDITAPEKLTGDPRTGRLTLNGFFTSRRNLIARAH